MEFESDPTKAQHMQHMQDFIQTFRKLELLWNPNAQHYSQKKCRCEAYEQLLVLYKVIKPHATIVDLKNKINSMRSNFRKEKRLIEKSLANGIPRQESWMYDQLKFLSEDFSSSSRMYSTIILSDEEGVEDENSTDYSECPVKKLKYLDQSQQDTSSTYLSHLRTTSAMESDSSQVEYKYNSAQRSTATSVCSVPSGSNAVGSTTNYNEDLVKVWTAKLSQLEPMQRILAEKAINDILFEATLGTLHRNSIRINVEEKTHDFKYCETLFNGNGHIKTDENES